MMVLTETTCPVKLQSLLGTLPWPVKSVGWQLQELPMAEQKDNCASHESLPLQNAACCATDSSACLHARMQAEVSGSANQTCTRQLVLTSAALIERHSVSYEVAEWRQLALIAALVRFIDQPQWLAIEWADGARPTMYITPARDALLSALLDAAQVLCPC